MYSEIELPSLAAVVESVRGEMQTLARLYERNWLCNASSN